MVCLVSGNQSLSPRALSWINIASGLLIALFGVLMLVR